MSGACKKSALKPAALAGWLCVSAASLVTAAPPEPALLNTLPQNGIQTAFQILRRDYIRRDDLTFEELNRAALQGLLERLDFGASLVALDAAKPEVAAGVHQEFLAPDIAYLRPESFGEGVGDMFAKALREVAGKKATCLFLDLRAGGTGSFDEAAKVLECFVPAGEVIFKLKQLGRDDAELFVSRGETIWSGSLVLLVDADTTNAAETVAAFLKQRRGALVAGEKTRGATVRYTELNLDGKTALRYASAEMLLPDNTSLFKKGISPHIQVALPKDKKDRILKSSRGASLKPYIVDRVRPRYNEAALVKGSNPELDDYVRRSQGKPLPGDDGQLRDLVIQRAIDLVQSDSFFAGSKLKWGQPAPAPAEGPAIPKAQPANE